jgi:hypothetical protein
MDSGSSRASWLANTGLQLTARRLQQRGGRGRSLGLASSGFERPKVCFGYTGGRQLSPNPLYGMRRVTSL